MIFATRKTLCRTALFAVCVLASSISIAQEATTPPAPTTVPAGTDVPQSIPVPSPTEPPTQTVAPATTEVAVATGAAKTEGAPHETESLDFSSMLFVFMLATFIGLGVILRVSRLLHTPLMSLTNAISAIAVVGSIMVTGSEKYPTGVRVLGAIALFASMTNIVSGFMITDRMLKMFKSPGEGGKR